MGLPKTYKSLDNLRGSSLKQTPLYIVELKGESGQRGFQHGKLLKEPIDRAVQFYHHFFREHLGFTVEEVRRRAARFIEPTQRLSSLLMKEYEGIAEGADQQLEDIFALSARYEITFEMVALGECSNVFVGPQRAQGHTLLGQNWDWRPEVSDFRAVIIARCEDVPDHVLVTECGQPGKYGFNEYGIGLIAAGLSCTEKASIGDNLFVAIGREALRHSNIADARQVFEQSLPRATVNFLLADAEGNAIDFEATPQAISSLDLRSDQVYWHTNHCRQSNERCLFPNSLIRGRRWAELTAASDLVDRETVQSWLTDSDNGADSICKKRDEEEAGSATWLQTICSIVMDLNQRTMWVHDDPATSAPFREIKL